jgi:effector-binding domain-containing protein
MDHVDRSVQILARWIEENGHHTDWFAREVYLDYCQDDTAKSVTELQVVLDKG